MTEASITNAQARRLADLMAVQHAVRATTHTVEIMGLPVTIVVLDHDDQRDGRWRSVHVLGELDSSVRIGLLEDES